MRISPYAIPIVVLLNAVVTAQPAAYTDLGNRSTTQSFDVAVTLTAANNVQWFRVELPAVSASLGSVDIWTFPTATPLAPDEISESEIAIFNAAGTLIASDDLDGPSLLSMLTFGRTAPSRGTISYPGSVPSLQRSGADGPLAGGVYWIAVGHWNLTVANGFVASSNYTGAERRTRLVFDVVDASVSAPFGPASVNPEFGRPGETLVCTVAVTPATNPPSTDIAVTVDAAIIDGGIVSLRDDGVAPDTVAGDNIFKGTIAIGDEATNGEWEIPYTIIDGQNRSTSDTVVFRVATQPTLFTDLGERTANTTFTTPITLLFGQDIQWYRIVLPPVSATNGYVDIWTSPSAVGPSMTDPEMALFGEDGALLAEDDDSGPGSFSQLSLGQVSPARPANESMGIGRAFGGQDGTLAGGTYWLAVGRYPIIFADPWGAIGIYGGSQRRAELTIRVNPGTVADAPSGTGIASPTRVLAGHAFDGVVSVVPAIAPASTDLMVTLDASTVLGGVLQMADDGIAPDDVAGDLHFAATVMVGADAVPGLYQLPFLISDGQMRAAAGTIEVEVVPTSDWDELSDGLSDAGNTPATFQIIPGRRVLRSITGTLSADDHADAYLIRIADPANFSATTLNPFNDIVDTKLFLFDRDGRGVALSDDVESPHASQQSTVSSAFVSEAGDYYLAISSGPAAIDSMGAALWASSPQSIERAPDGPGAANTWADFDASPNNEMGGYRILLSGARFVDDDCPVDINNDGEIGLTDLARLLRVFGVFANNVRYDIEADINLDGAIDLTDLALLLADFGTNCE